MTGSMGRRLRRAALALIALPAAAALSGCGDAPPATPTSGRITVYTAIENDLITPFLAAFNARYPDISVSIVRNSTGVITARLIAERANPQADVIWGTAASSMMALERLGMLEPYAPAGLERILPMFRCGLETPAWVGINAWEAIFVVNAIELERLGLGIDDIRCYEDLLRPELRGHIVMPHPASSGTGFLTVAGILQLLGRDTGAGWEFLERLHGNISQYTHSGSAPANMAATGETVVGISFGFAGIRQARAGAPIHIVFPEKGSGWDMEANALVRRDNIHPAALTFLDWAISDEAMALYNEHFPIVATGAEIAEGGRNPVDQLIENDFAWIAENREAILAEWSRRF